MFVYSVLIAFAKVASILTFVASISSIVAVSLKYSAHAYLI